WFAALGEVLCEPSKGNIPPEKFGEVLSSLAFTWFAALGEVLCEPSKGNIPMIKLGEVLSSLVRGL
ncbi:MAG: hypothetical protein ACLUI9_09900, partial [[Clostridium] scindens]